MKKTYCILSFILAYLSADSSFAQSRKRIADWNEVSVLAGITNMKEGTKPSNYLGVSYEGRFEKHSMVYSVLRNEGKELSVDSVSIGAATYPDWELPFEPGVEGRVGYTSVKTDFDSTSGPSATVKVSFTALKKAEIGLGVRFFGEWTSFRLGDNNATSYTSGIQIIWGAK